MIRQYKKKPVVIEAICFDQDSFRECMDFLGRNVKSAGLDDTNRLYAIIPTLEGDHRCDDGDYIIKGIKSEFYPCKPDIFKLTYEELTTPAN